MPWTPEKRRIAALKASITMQNRWERRRALRRHTQTCRFGGCDKATMRNHAHGFCSIHSKVIEKLEGI